MTKVRCKTCVGSGKVMGGGMMQHDCDDCDGYGKITITEDDITKSKSYDKAISEIKALDSSMSDEKAKEIFDKELKKLDEENERKPKRGRPKKT